jgi:acetylornithine deacetylase/succinyl-diaminopimelate desuccinylase-like protein
VDKIIDAARSVCGKRGLKLDIVAKVEAVPVALSGYLIDIMEQKARERNIQTLRMVSGASHDAAIMVGVSQTGMIFVPSKGGRSHCSEEFTTVEDIKLGAEILLATVVELSS